MVWDEGSHYACLRTSWESLVIADEVKIGGEFDFSFVNGKLKLNAKDVVINGLNIPKFTWGWVGLAVAQGVLSAFGGAVFGALASAIFAGSEKSIEQLLKEQLAEIAKIVEEKLQDNDLRNYQARASALIHLFEEYSNDQTERRLDQLVETSAESLAEIQSLGFKGYRTFMSTAGLRMTILQEVIKNKNTEGTRKNFELQKSKAVAFHKEMIDAIEKETDPKVQYDRAMKDGAWYGGLSAFGYRMDSDSPEVVAAERN